jgi:hypothetical protein
VISHSEVKPDRVGFVCRESKNVPPHPAQPPTPIRKATVKATSTAYMYRFPSVDMWHANRYWRDRVDRAIATRLLSTDALLRAQRENLALTRHRLTLRAASLRGADARELGRVARQMAEFHRAHGRLLKRAKQLRQHVARYTANSLRQTGT